MKKIIFFFLCSIVAVGLLTACATEETEPAVTGGWTESETDEIPENAAEAFQNAMKTYDGETLTVVSYLGSQVVAGVNFKYICETEDGTQKTVVVYRDLDGNASVTDVTDYTK